MLSTNTPAPWERQPEETPKAYAAFCEYRDMGAERSLDKVATKLNKSSTLIARWSSKYKWVERVAAWDDEQERIARIAAQKENIQAIKDMRKRHATLATSMLIKAAKALGRIPEDEIKAGDISRMVDIASKLERISRGDVGEVVEERDGGKAAPAVTFYIPDNGRDRDEEE